MFLFADQGVCGVNVFTYCGNDPINKTDLTGFYPSENCAQDYWGWIGAEIGMWFYDYVLSPLDAHTGGKITETVNAVADNVVIDVGVGMGYQVSAEIVEELSIDAGIHYDPIQIHISGGEVSAREYASQGFSVDLHSFVDDHSTAQYRRYGSSKWQEDTQDVFEFVGVSGYFIIGGTISIGFDFTTFYATLGKIWR